MMQEPMSGIVADIVDQVPELVGTYEEHLRDHPAVLPHIFVADLARWVTQRYIRGTEADLALVRRTLEFLEDRYLRGPEVVQELIGVSFVEMLPSTGDRGADLKELLGPNLRDQFRLLNW